MQCFEREEKFEQTFLSIDYITVANKFLSLNDFIIQYFHNMEQVIRKKNNEMHYANRTVFVRKTRQTYIAHTQYMYKQNQYVHTHAKCGRIPLEVGNDNYSELYNYQWMPFSL